jgi:hypothetical protein
MQRDMFNIDTGPFAALINLEIAPKLSASSDRRLENSIIKMDFVNDKHKVFPAKQRRNSSFV